MDAIGKHQQPRMKACFAYGMLPLDSDVVQEGTQEDMHLYDVVPSDTSAQDTSLQQLPANKQEEDDCYEYIPWPLNDSPATPQVSQTEKSPYGNVPTQKKTPTSPNADDEDVVYAEAAAVLGRVTGLLSINQIRELVTMLQSTKSGEPNNQTSEEEEIYEEPVVSPIPPPIPPTITPPKPPSNPPPKPPSTPPPKSRLSPQPPSIPPPKSRLSPQPPSVKDDIIDIYPDIDEDTYAEVLDLPKGSHKDPDIYDTLPPLPRPSTTRKTKPPPPPKPTLGAKGLAMPQARQSHLSATKTLSKLLPLMISTTITT